MTLPKRRLILRWNTSKNFVATVLFIILVGLIEYAILASSAAEAKETTSIVLPLINLEISPSFHLLPATVLVSLIACFIHFTTHIATTHLKPKPARKVRSSKGKLRFKTIRQSWRKVVRAGRRTKNRILQNSSISYIVRQIVAAKALIKGGFVVIATFTFIVLLVSIVAYPALVKTAITGFLTGNEGFRGFVISTIRASEGFANVIAPIGVLAASIHSGLTAVAPAFKNSFEGVGSMLTAGLVSLKPIEKYVLTQNVAVWVVIAITLIYTRFFRIIRR